MNGWTITKVFRVNGKLTVADTIEQAIELYRKYASPNTVEITSVEQVTGGMGAADGALTIDVQDMERHYASQLAKLEEECERLKQGRQHVYVHQRFDKGKFDGKDAETVRKVKHAAAMDVAEYFGRMLVSSSWAYCDITETGDDMWMSIGMFVQELPPEKYGQTLSAFIGIEDNRS